MERLHALVDTVFPLTLPPFAPPTNPASRSPSQSSSSAASTSPTMPSASSATNPNPNNNRKNPNNNNPTISPPNRAPRTAASSKTPPKAGKPRTRRHRTRRQAASSSTRRRRSCCTRRAHPSCRVMRSRGWSSRRGRGRRRRRRGGGGGLGDVFSGDFRTGIWVHLLVFWGNTIVYRHLFVFVHVGGFFLWDGTGIGIGIWGSVGKDLRCVADISFSCRNILFFGGLLLCIYRRLEVSFRCEAECFWRSLM